MKLSFALVLLPAAAYGQPTGKFFDCKFTKYFGSEDTLDESGTEDFVVVTGGDVRCYTTCKSGGATTVVAGSETTEDTEDCKTSTSFTANEDQTQLSWSVTTDVPFQYMVLTCFCTDDGSGATIDDAGNIIDDIKDFGNNLDDQAGCFSESTLVSVKGKGDVAMADLKLGDIVLTEKNNYQPVYSFGHRKPETQMEFYQIFTDESENPLEMTGNHMIMVVDKKGRHQAIRADLVQVGDHLLQTETKKRVAVTAVKTDQKRGLYMPLTPNGKISVNGLLASNYISISDEAPGVVAHSNWFFTFLAMPEQALSHWWLSPFRMMCMGVSSSYCSNGDEELTAHYQNPQDKGILPWLITGRKLAEVVELQHSLIQMIVFGFPTFLIFGLFNFVETIFFGPSVAPSLFVLSIIAALVVKKMKNKKNASEEEEDELAKKLLV